MFNKSLFALFALTFAACGNAEAHASTPASAPSSTGQTTAPPPAEAAPSTQTAVTPEPPIVMSVGSLTLRTPSAGLLGHTLTFSGSTSPRRAKRTVLIERYEPLTDAWTAATSAPINRHGSFVAKWLTNLSGRVSVRAVVSSSARARTASSESSAPAQITIYRPAIATYFGPGFYGQQTACGQTLTPLTVGVANRKLPCGTLVEVSYGGHRLTVPVIDRGPFANGASWDLTEAAAQALDVTETVDLGTLVVGATPNVPTLGLSPKDAEALTLTGGTTA
jgi:rare lipoprotein A (peptidoglycan hydrolase)